MTDSSTRGRFTSRTWMLVLSTSLVLAASVTAGQAALPFDTLTVPSSRLVDGCALASSSISPRENWFAAVSWKAGLPITTNPWSGSERSIVAAIRAGIEPMPRVPDGPPLSASQAARFRMRWADGVEEAYAAVYSNAVPKVVVHALRFAQTPLPLAPPANSTSIRIERDRLVVVVSGPAGPCRDLVATYIREVTSR